MTPKQRSRARVVQALYQWLVSGEDIKKIEQQFLNQKEGKISKAFFSNLLLNIPKNISSIEKIILSLCSSRIRAVFKTLFVNIGATIGAGFAFLFARYIIGAKLQEKYSTQLEKFNKELTENKYQYLFSLRFLPIFPFFLVNFLAGLTKVDFKTFIITTSLGIIPGSFVYTYAGSQLSSINALSDIFSKEILSAFLLLGFLTLVPVIVKKFKK